MNLNSAYNVETGLFTGRQVGGDVVGLLELNTRPGEAWFSGPCDVLRQRVVIVNGEPELASYTPAAPAATGWAWNAARHCWEPEASAAALAAAARAERDHLLAQCDWVTSRGLDLGQPVPPAWAAYRQALRDITSLPDFPNNITWPQAPSP